MSKKYRKQQRTVATAAARRPQVETAALVRSTPSVLLRLLLPHNAFAVLALLFGIIYILVLPPFQVPDECAHLNRTYELSEFKVTQTVQGTKSGNYLPASLDSAVNRFNFLWFRPGVKINREQIDSAFDIRLEKEKTKFTPTSAGNYFYFSYLPQLPAMFIGRMLNLNVLYILYFGKFLALFFYVFCVWHAIRIMPTAKFLMLLIALLPMSLAQAGSFSPDCVSYSLAFLAVALILDMALNRKPFVFNGPTILMLAIIGLMGILKPTYLPFCLLILILPRSLFQSRAQWLATTTLTIILSTVLTLGWVKLMSAAGGMQVNVDVNGEKISPNEKVQALLHHPTLAFDVLDKTLDRFQPMYYRTTLGVFGYLDTMLPEAVYTVLSFLLVFLALFESDRRYRFTFSQRVLFVVISIGIFMATIFTMYLLTRDVSGLIVEGVQGRYFIPALLPFFLTWNGLLRWRLNPVSNKLLAFFIYITMVVILVNTVMTIYDRYYVEF